MLSAKSFSWILDSTRRCRYFLLSESSITALGLDAPLLVHLQSIKLHWNICCDTTKCTTTIHISGFSRTPKKPPIWYQSQLPHQPYIMAHLSSAHSTTRSNFNFSIAANVKTMNLYSMFRINYAVFFLPRSAPYGPLPSLRRKVFRLRRL